MKDKFHLEDCVAIDCSEVGRDLLMVVKGEVLRLVELLSRFIMSLTINPT
jgi:hypothetical protein